MATQGSVDWKKTALLVIDMQNDFILPGGPMSVGGGASIVPAVKEAVAVAREKGALIVWVVREHDAYGRDVELFKRHFYAEGKERPTTKGSKGAELVGGLIIQEGDYKVVPTRFSAFFATNLHYLLQGAGISSVVIVGVQTPNCIRQTVFDAVALDYSPVIVLADATAAATPEVHAGSSSGSRDRKWSRPFMACVVGSNPAPSRHFFRSCFACFASGFANVCRSGSGYSGVMADLLAIPCSCGAPSKTMAAATGCMAHGMSRRQTLFAQTVYELNVHLPACPLCLRRCTVVPRYVENSRKPTDLGYGSGFKRQGLFCAWV